MTVRMTTTKPSDKAHDHRLKADSNEVVIGAITIRMMQGLLFSHFAKRGRGRPKKNTEVPRLMAHVAQSLAMSRFIQFAFAD